MKSSNIDTILLLLFSIPTIPAFMFVLRVKQRRNNVIGLCKRLILEILSANIFAVDQSAYDYEAKSSCFDKIDPRILQPKALDIFWDCKGREWDSMPIRKTW